MSPGHEVGVSLPNQDIPLGTEAVPTPFKGGNTSEGIATC
jgi:hypothetical protein